jgi:hypothetical protein
MRGKGEVHVEGDVVDEGTYAAIVEVHGVYVSGGITANTVYDDVIFVASVGTDGEVAGPADVVEGREGAVCCVEGGWWVGGRGARAGIVASVATTSLL